MSTTKKMTQPRPVTKTVPYVQETMSKAFGMLFSHANMVSCKFHRTKDLINVICEADGLVAHLVIYDAYELNDKSRVITLNEKGGVA